MPTIISSLKTLYQKHWVIGLAVLFFIAWKFFLIHTLWHDRSIPPNPDDSFVYILHIDSSLRCANLFSCSDQAFNFDTYGGFDHLTYRVIFGSIGKLFGLNAIETYHTSFYLGTVLLVVVLTFFLTRFPNTSKLSVAATLLALALYNGSGSYHGFFWVVPSFFSLLLFFLIFSIFFDRKASSWKLKLLFLVPAGIFTHVLGLYLLAVIPLFLGFYSIITHQIDWLQVRKFLFIAGTAAITYIPVGFYFSQFSYGNPYGPDVLVRHIAETHGEAIGIIEPKKETPLPLHEATTIAQPTLSQQSLFPGLPKIKSDYFRWIFPSFIGYPIFVAVLVILIIARRFELLSFYCASLLFIFFSSLSPYGERSLILIWPITFIIYAEGVCYSFRIIRGSFKEKLLLRQLAYILLSTSTAVGIVIAGSYSYLWNIYLNQARDIIIPDALVQYLSERIPKTDHVAYSTDMNFLDNYLFWRQGSNRPIKTILLKEADYYVRLSPERIWNDQQAYQTTFNQFFITIKKVIFFNRRMLEKEEETPPLIEQFFSPKPEEHWGDIEVLRSKTVTTKN